MKKRILRNTIAVLFCIAMVLAASACAIPQNSQTSEGEDIVKLYLYGDMEKMSEEEDVRKIDVLLMQDDQITDYYATINFQITSIEDSQKHDYTIKFYSDASYEEAYELDMGWGAQSVYTLNANWSDKTHSRNLVTAKLAAEIQSRYGVLEQTPNYGQTVGIPVEVYINEQFHGLYTMEIPRGAELFAMDEENPNHILMRGVSWDMATVFRAAPNLPSWSIEVGPEGQMPLVKFAKLVAFIIGSSDERFKKEFEEHIDLDAMLTYYILMDFAYLQDNGGRNILMATYDGKIWYPSLYDLDASWGVDYTGEALCNYQNDILPFTQFSLLSQRFEQAFPQEISDRYFELREDILTKEHVLELFDTFDSSIPKDTRKKETKRWGKDIPGYDLTQIEEYLDDVLDGLDEKYRNLAE